MSESGVQQAGCPANRFRLYTFITFGNNLRRTRKLARSGKERRDFKGSGTSTRLRDSFRRSPIFQFSISRGSSQAHAKRAEIFRRAWSLFPPFMPLRLV